MAIVILNDKDRELLKSKSAMALPDNPSNKSLSARQIKAKFYECSLLLFEWLRQTQGNIIDEIGNIQIQIDDLNNLKGEQGPQGEPGKTPSFAINAKGELICTFED